MSAGTAPQVPLAGRSDSLRRRYAAKLGANIVAFGANAVTQLIVPRALGPVLFGQYSYLTNFFTQLVGFFDAGTSIGFFTRLSQRQDDRGLVRFYALLVAAIGVLLTVAVALAFAAGLERLLWPGQTARYVWMGLAFGWLAWVAQVTGQMLDAYGLTVPAELMRVVQKLVGALALVALFVAGWISLDGFFLYQYAALVLLVALWAVVLGRHGHALVPRLDGGAFANYAREMYGYAGPLAAMGVATLVVGLLDRWLLQWFGGSGQQGFYGLSAQVGALCFLFTSALTPIWMREMAMAWARDDRAEIRRMFLRYIPMLFGLAAFIAVFVAWQGWRIAALVGGTAYQGAGAAVAIMALYPAHQTYGQLSGSMLPVSGQTRLYRNIAIAAAMMGLPATLWLLAPERSGGLGMGATGLAIKMVGVQLVAVNVQLWYNARELGLSFGRLLGQQIATLGILVLAGGASTTATNRLGLPLIPALVVAGVLYTVCCAIAVGLLPTAFGTSRTALRADASRLFAGGAVRPPGGQD